MVRTPAISIQLRRREVASATSLCLIRHLPLLHQDLLANWQSRHHLGLPVRKRTHVSSDTLDLLTYRINARRKARKRRPILYVKPPLSHTVYAITYPYRGDEYDREISDQDGPLLNSDVLDVLDTDDSTPAMIPLDRWLPVTRHTRRELHMALLL